MKFIITMVLFFSTLTLSAQTPKITWGPEYKATGGENLLLGTDGTHFYTINGDREKPSLTKFDLNCRLVSITPLGVNDNRGKREELFVYNVLKTEGHIYLITYGQNSKTGFGNYYYNELVNGRLTSPPTLFHSTPVKHEPRGTGTYSEYSRRFQFISSPNGKLVVHFNYAPVKDKKQLISVFVFDEKLKTLWHQEVTVEIEANYYVPTDVAIDNNGQAYLFAMDLTIDKNANRSEVLFLHVFNSDKHNKFTLFNHPETKYSSSQLYLTPENELIIAGLYRVEGESYDAQMGLHYCKFANGKITNKTYKFSEEFMSDLRITDSEKDNKFLTGFDPSTNFIFYPDGSFLFIAERNIHYADYTFNYASGFILSRFSSTGELISLNKITRYFQNKRDSDDQLSFSYFIKNHDLFFLFNTMVDENGEIPKKGTNVDLCEFPEAGKPGIKTLFNDKESKMLLSARFYLDLGNGKYLIRKSDDKLYNYGLINL